MTKRIDKLTAEQEARLPEWRDKWIAIGLSTERADRPKFEAAVTECYRYAKLDPPKRVVWVTSPVAMALAAPLAAGIIAHVAVGGAVGGAVGDAVDDAVGAAVGVAVRDAVRVAVRGAVGDAVHDAVGGAVRVAVGVAVDGRSRLWRELWHRYIGGQFWVGGWYWGSPSWVSFFREVCGLELSPEIERAASAYQATAESACWWWPHRDFVIACERPTELHRDDRGRLHNDAGASIAWPDGWALHHVHGVRVPSDIIERPESLTIDRIEKEGNAEIRRVMIDRYGRDRYVREGGWKVEDEDTDPLGFPRRLLSKRFPDGREIVFAELPNSTPEPDGSRKVYHLGVHPEVRPILGGGQLGGPQKRTAINAVASTYGMTGKEYQLALET